MDPRTRITESGYIKSRFLDDKLSTAILLGFAKYVKDEDLKLSRKVYQHITVFEEVSVFFFMLIIAFCIIFGIVAALYLADIGFLPDHISVSMFP